MTSVNLLASLLLGGLALLQRLGESLLRLDRLLSRMGLLQAYMLLLRSCDLFMMLTKLLLVPVMTVLMACERVEVSRRSRGSQREVEESSLGRATGEVGGWWPCE